MMMLAIAIGITIGVADKPREEADQRVTPDAVRIGRVENGVILKQTITSTALTLEIAGLTRRATSVDVPLALAAGTNVVGMTVTIGKETTRADVLAASAGHQRYFDLVRRSIDPALLEHVVSTATSEQFMLRVFPVNDTQHATVTIELGQGASVVDAEQSLYANGNASVPGRVPIVVIGCGGRAHRMRYMDKATIRRYVKLQMPRLRHCYQRELLRTPSLAGTAEMHFVIKPDGTLGDVTVDGTLPSDTVKQCIADDLATWKLSPTDETTMVNYPLTFVAGT